MQSFSKRCMDCSRGVSCSSTKSMPSCLLSMLPKLRQTKLGLLGSAPQGDAKDWSRDTLLQAMDARAAAYFFQVEEMAEGLAAGTQEVTDEWLLRFCQLHQLYMQGLCAELLHEEQGQRKLDVLSTADFFRWVVQHPLVVDKQKQNGLCGKTPQTAHDEAGSREKLARDLTPTTCLVHDWASEGATGRSNLCTTATTAPSLKQDERRSGNSCLKPRTPSHIEAKNSAAAAALLAEAASLWEGLNDQTTDLELLAG
eukprot:CAMPEP_0178416072 /NCGR_PEP_ID=MMETSP0689_2-20121128/23873_1 /TAXON_ID=160604 /ORGANISM="Amphidinium massartii, Strain CS-259" /LENGTH=254 /DNA_ID=CAMNT_0020037401 /DNA_START=106 /DNA_END=870 /DNA_ORIENTATION=+